MTITSIIAEHAKWLRNENGAHRADLTDANLWDANLTGANLTGANLTRADLTDANLTDANLTRANLWDANLRDANLTGANLTRANLTDANLTGADLTGANLTGANLTRANLTDANLTGANLTGANLTRANLTDANLTGANLTRANLTGANLTRANLTDANLPPFSICPEDGAFTAYKKLREGCIATLTIPADAARTSSRVGRKCRASVAHVVSIVDGDGHPVASCSGLHKSSFVYRVGEVSTPDRYDGNPNIECTHGIHFFITRAEAEAYDC